MYEKNVIKNPNLRAKECEYQKYKFLFKNKIRERSYDAYNESVVIRILHKYNSYDGSYLMSYIFGELL